MRVVFLDFDGVLNDLSTPRIGEWEGKTWGWYWISAHLVSKLNRIIEATEAKVVISSSWRRSWEKAQLQRMLDEQGFQGEVIGATPVLAEGQNIKHLGTRDGVTIWPDRSDEVLGWIASFKELNPNHDFSYVAIDDQEDAFLNTPGINLVVTDPDKGISDDDAERAIEILLK